MGKVNQLRTNEGGSPTTQPGEEVVQQARMVIALFEAMPWCGPHIKKAAKEDERREEVQSRETQRGR